MKKVWLWHLLLCSVLFADSLSPKQSIEASGNVQSIVYSNGQIIAGTSVGTLEVFKAADGKRLANVHFPLIKDFMGDEVAPKLFSVDVLEGSQTYLSVVQASNGARALYIVENQQPKVLIDASKNWFIAKARFLDSNRILVALLSNELIVWDIKKAQAQYQVQINPSHFSDFSLNSAKTQAACSNESGEIAIVDVATGKTVKTLKGGNVDNVYKVDFKTSKVLCAGQDRRGIVYEYSTGNFERFDAEFLIYAGALSPDESLGAFAFNENNDIVLFDLKKRAAIHTLKGQKSTLNTILFTDNHHLISSSDDQFIMMWSIP